MKMNKIKSMLMIMGVSSLMVLSSNLTIAHGETITTTTTTGAAVTVSPTINESLTLIKPGETLKVSSKLLEQLSITLNDDTDYLKNAIKYDIIAYNQDGSIYAMYHDKTMEDRAALYVPKGGWVRLTNTSTDDLKIHVKENTTIIDDNSNISFEKTNIQALARTTLQPSQKISFKNNTSATTKIDFGAKYCYKVVYPANYVEGTTISGFDAVFVTLKQNEKVDITNNNTESVTLYSDASIDGYVNNDPTLIKSGESLKISNKLLEQLSITLNDDTAYLKNTIKYDIISYNQDGSIYGIYHDKTIEDRASLYLPKGGYVRITNKSADDLKIHVTENSAIIDDNSNISFEKTTIQALARTTLQPSQTLSFKNDTLYTTYIDFGGSNCYKVTYPANYVEGTKLYGYDTDHVTVKPNDNIGITNDNSAPVIIYSDSTIANKFVMK